MVPNMWSTWRLVVMANQTNAPHPWSLVAEYWHTRNPIRPRHIPQLMHQAGAPPRPSLLNAVQQNFGLYQYRTSSAQDWNSCYCFGTRVLASRF